MTLDAILTDALAITGLPGLAAMAATRDGIIHSAAVGERAPGQPMTTDSVARIASMTKAITTVVALRLVERGLLTLDDPVCDVLPELVEPMILERFGVDGNPIMHKATKPITLRQLLTHTAGFGYGRWNQPLFALESARKTPRIPTSSEELRNTPLLFEPGTKWNYGINTDVVGRACEVVSGKRLDVLVAEEITGPLGMVDTKFITTPEMEARRITQYQRSSAGVLTPSAVSIPATMPFMCGGGGLHSTAADYMKFVQAILAGTILGPEMYGEMIRPQTGELNMLPMITAQPAESCDVHMYPEMEVKWSLGFMMNMEQTAEGRSAGSLAWAGLCNTYYWIDLKRGVCGVFFAQLLPFADPATLHAFAAYEAAVYRSLS